MKKYFGIAIAALSLLAACAKEQMTAPQSENFSLTVSISDTKTSFGDLSEGKRPVYWSNGDQICVNGVVSEPLSGIEAQCTSAEFVFEQEPQAPYNIVYPAASYVNASTINIPNSQSKVSEVVLAGANGSVSAATAILKLRIVKGEKDAKLFRIDVSADDNRQMSGNFTIDYATGALTATDPSGKNAKVEYRVSNTLSETATEFYIPVPAGQYGFTVKVVDFDGHFMTKSTTSAKTLVAGQISAMPEFAYNPTGTELGVEITSAADLVKFAQDWNEGKYSTRVVANVTNDLVFDDQTNADFRKTLGIGKQGVEEEGTTDNYFEGIFNGNGHSIKNLVNYEKNAADSIVLSIPLFAFTGKSAVISNFTLDNSCDIKFHYGIYCAPVVGRNKGQLKDITNNADLVYTFVAGTNNIAGIAARNYGGIVDNCTMNGSITCGVTLGSSKTYTIGGICATVEDGGIVKDSNMTGKILWGLGSAADGPNLNGGTLYIGGIAGHVIKGQVDNCTNTASEPLDARGKARLSCIGGIAGLVEEGTSVLNSTNTNQIYIRQKGPNTVEEEGKSFTGGIVGQNKGTVAGCENKAQVTGNNSQVLLAVGGVIGENTGTVNNCTNTGKIGGASQYGTTLECYVGGVIGRTSVSVSDLTTDGNIDWSPAKDKDNFGMLVGATKVLGGVIGCIDGQNVVVENLKTTAATNVKYHQTNKKNGAGSIVGGLVGYIKDCNAIVRNSETRATILNDNFDNTYSNTTGSAITGGIVGLATAPEGQNVTITNCNAYGPYAVRRGILGGIVGWAVNVNVTECDVEANAGNTPTENIAAFLGGVVGKGYATTVSKCNVKGELHTKGSTAQATYGGIAGILDSECTVEECTFIGIMKGNGAASAGEDIWGSICGASSEGTLLKGNGVQGYCDVDGQGTITDFDYYTFCGDLNFTDEDNYIIED